jgi:two-component system, NarL family, nitrate/nitrite response regulator NarL
MALELALLIHQRILREALSQALPLRGHRVLLACGTRDELFASMERVKPQVVVVDFDLPNEDTQLESAGIDILKALRAWYPDLRILVLATSPDADLVEHVHQAGAHGLLDKDAGSLPLLTQALASVSEGQRFFPVAAVVAPSLSPSPLPARPSSLTDRELEVLRYIAVGADNLRIALQLKVSERTVRAHVSALYRKLAARNRVALALHAGRLGLKTPDL